MLFKRYGDPTGILKTYTFKALPGFLNDLYEQEQEDSLWELWLAKEFEDKSFNDFKNRNLKRARQPKAKAITEEDEKRIFAFTDQFIKPSRKGGERTK